MLLCCRGPLRSRLEMTTAARLTKADSSRRADWSRTRKSTRMGSSYASTLMFTSLPIAYRVVLTLVMEHLSVCAVTMSPQHFKAKSKQVFQAVAQAIIPIDIDGSMTEAFHRFARNFWLLGCACSVPA